MTNVLKNAVEATERVEHPEIELLTESLQLPDGAGAVRDYVRLKGEELNSDA